MPTIVTNDIAKRLHGPVTLFSIEHTAEEEFCFVKSKTSIVRLATQGSRFMCWHKIVHYAALGDAELFPPEPTEPDYGGSIWRGN
jgi:hypothetical protein